MSSIGTGKDKYSSRRQNVVDDTDLIGIDIKKKIAMRKSPDVRAANLLNMSPLSSIQASY